MSAIDDRSKTNDFRKIEVLLQMVDLRKKSKFKTNLLNSVDVLNGYDLVFLLSLIMKNNFSGNLIVVNEENLLSGIQFIYGDIVKIDYPDQDLLLGNLIVETEIISKFEMQEVIAKIEGHRLGNYLVENGLITQQQLRKLLFKQATLRLKKYLTSLSVQVKFSFDGESNDSVLITKVDYFDLLYNWIFDDFKEEWFEEYGLYYQKQNFQSDIGTNNLQQFKDYPKVYDLAFKISQFNKSILSFNDIFKVAYQTRPVFIRLLHFLVLTGNLYVFKDKYSEQSNTHLPENKNLVQTLDSDLRIVHQSMLNKKYFDAFSLLNKYSQYMNSHPTVRFYFVWIKLIGAYYHNHLIDINKISKDFYDLDYSKVNQGEFYYVQALLFKVMKKDSDAATSYSRAIFFNTEFKRHPIEKKLTMIARFFKFIGLG